MKGFRLFEAAEAVECPAEALPDADEEDVLLAQRLLQQVDGSVGEVQCRGVVACAVQHHDETQCAFRGRFDDATVDAPADGSSQQCEDVRCEQGEQVDLQAAFRHLGQGRKETYGSLREEFFALVLRGAARHAVEQHSVRAQAAGAAGYEFGEGVVEEPAQGRFDSGGRQVRARFGACQQAQGERVVGPARQ